MMEQNENDRELMGLEKKRLERENILLGYELRAGGCTHHRMFEGEQC